jgi:hypothetical protein
MFRSRIDDERFLAGKYPCEEGVHTRQPRLGTDGKFYVTTAFRSAAESTVEFGGDDHGIEKGLIPRGQPSARISLVANW